MDEDDVSDSGIQPPCYTPPEIPAHLLPPDESGSIIQSAPTVEIIEVDACRQESQEIDMNAGDETEPEPRTESVESVVEQPEVIIFDEDATHGKQFSMNFNSSIVFLR